jgi:naphthoate synthase
MGWQHIQFLTLGYKRMREWQLTGRTIDAEQAKDWGVINSIVPDDQLEEETMRWAKAVGRRRSRSERRAGRSWGFRRPSLCH